jgi:TonB family protein
MTARIPLFAFMPYGAPELMAASRRHLLGAQATSCALMIALFAALVLIVSRMPHTSPVDVVIPSIQIEDFKTRQVSEPVLPKVPRVAIATAAKSGIVVPVPVDTKEVQSVVPDRDLTAIPGTPSVIDAPQSPPASEAIEPLPVRGDYVYYEEGPVVLVHPKPIYPEIARQAAVEGRVIVHILIGKDGRVVRAELDEGVHEVMLDQAALDAARQWQFTPAMSGHHPVAVWETLPFVFKLH